MHFFKTHDCNVFCENSAFRRDWRSSGHLLEGLGPHASDPGRQSGSRKPLSRPRRTNQHTVVIGARPAPLLPQNGLLASTARTFSTTCVFAYVCSFRRSVVIRVRPAPSFDQHGPLAWTVRTFQRRLMFIMFGRFQKTAPLCGRRPIWGRLGCLLGALGPLREARPQRHPKGTPRMRFGSSGVVS